MRVEISESATSLTEFDHHVVLLLVCIASSVTA